jgi:protein gp37
MTATKIEWTDFSWNPIRAAHAGQRTDPNHGKLGWFCVHVSPGCVNCYSETMNRRIGTGIDYKAQNAKQVKVFLDDKMLLAPLKWKKPRKVFVCSMTDLFADFVTDEMIDRMFAVMALCPQHTFQVLTKRPERMRAYITQLHDEPPRDTAKRFAAVWPAKIPVPVDGITIPLPNVWLGTSCEDQATADERIPHLLATPAAIRFLSCEPLLGEIDLASPYTHELFQALFKEDVERGIASRASDIESTLFGLHWVICGGESGPNARPMHPDWARSLRDQCAEAGVAFHFKQWGEWSPVYDRAKDDPDWRRCEQVAQRTPRGQWLNLAGGQGFHGECVVRVDRVGKKRAGRLLDGVEHNGFPEVRT